MFFVYLLFIFIFDYTDVMTLLVVCGLKNNLLVIQQFSSSSSFG